MCGKRCTIECSAKEPTSAPRKGGGTANLGVYMSLAPMHPHHGPTWDADVWCRSFYGALYTITRAHPNTYAPSLSSAHSATMPQSPCAPTGAEQSRENG